MDFPLNEMLSKKTLKVTNRGITNYTTGTKTIGTSSTELYAGSQPLAERKRMLVMATSGTVYIGKTGVTPSNGFPILPGYENRFEIEFDPSAPVSVYAVASANTIIRIWEEA